MMKLTKQMCYEIIKSKDSRFDGVFYTAVKTTGIYCRPVCKVPAPKLENCEFYESVFQAENAGFRPCLRCRPEMAPEYSEFEQSDYLIKQILAYFEEENYCTGLVQKSSDNFGISVRHISRLFQQKLGISAQQYIMTKRLLNGKRLLQDTRLSVTEIAGIVGFGSTNRFYQALKSKYKMTPSDIRGKEKKAPNRDWITVKLSYRPPYRWHYVMAYLKMRAIPQVEWVDEFDVYRRTLRIIENETVYQGYIEVKPMPDENYVSVKVSAGLEKVLLQVLSKIKRVFDLDAVPEALPEGIDKGVRLPGCFDGFEIVLRAIIGQQITVKAATTLAGRLVSEYGATAITPWEELTRFFPSPQDFLDKSNQQVARDPKVVHDPKVVNNAKVVHDTKVENDNIVDTLGKVGIISSRGHAITSVVEAIVNHEITFDTSNGPDKLIENLMKIKGIGIWTAQYVAMRSLSWPDIFLESDLIIKQKLMPHLDSEQKYTVAAQNYAEDYKPWRSYLTFSIWQDHFDVIN